MKTLETSTGLIPFINVGTYSSSLAPENMFDDYMIEQDKKDGYIDYTPEQFWDMFSNELYMDKLTQLAGDFLADNLLPALKNLNIGITDLKPVRIHSPKYYNFETDVLYFDIEAGEDFYTNLLKLVEKSDPEKLRVYLKENFSSRDGFMSFTANNRIELYERIKEESVREASVFLYYYIMNETDIDIDENQEELQMSFETICMENMFYSEFTKV